MVRLWNTKVMTFEMETKEPFLHLCLTHTKSFDSYMAIVDSDEWLVSNATVSDVKDRRTVAALVAEEADKVQREQGKLLCSLMMDVIVAAVPTSPSRRYVAEHFATRNDIFDADFNSPNAGYYTHQKSFHSTWITDMNLHFGRRCDPVFPTQLDDAKRVCKFHFAFGLNVSHQ
jgi:hypothetical protein